MKITRFEDIDAWKASRRLSRALHEATAPSRFRKTTDLKGQLRRAGSSAMANIAEGFNSGSDREFGRFLRIARKSATEVQSHLYAALDTGALNANEFDRLYGLAEDVKRLVGGFLRYLTTSRSRVVPRLRTAD